MDILNELENLGLSLWLDKVFVSKVDERQYIFLFDKIDHYDVLCLFSTMDDKLQRDFDIITPVSRLSEEEMLYFNLIHKSANFSEHEVIVSQEEFINKLKEVIAKCN
jgi:hypothetical protein